MDVPNTKGRRQRRRGVYRLPISAAASAKWKREDQPAQSKTQKRGRPAKRDPDLRPEERADLLAATATERPRAVASDCGGHGLCEDAFKQFVHECGEDIKGSNGCYNGDRLSLQCTTSDVGISNGCENNELGRESDIGGCVQETGRDSVLRFTDGKRIDCEEFLKVPEADAVSDLAVLRYNGDLQLSGSEASIEPEQNRETILTDITSEEQSSTAEHRTSSDVVIRDVKLCQMPPSQMFQDDPEESRERDNVSTELTAGERESTLNIAQLYESCRPDLVQESSLGTDKDIIIDHIQEDPWGDSLTLEQKCNLLEVTGEQRNSISEVNSAVENLLNQFPTTRIKVENSEPIFQGIEGPQEYILLEEEEGEVVLTLTVGDGGQLVPTAEGSGVQLPPGLAEQLAASNCVTTTATAPRGDVRGAGEGPLQDQEASMLLSDADLVLAEKAIEEALSGMGSPPPAQQQRRREERLHFGNLEEALDAIENGGPPRRQRTRQNHRQQQPLRRAPPKAAPLPAKMDPGVHKEVERAAKALFSKRTRTLYHWMYPETPKRKLKATVANAWDTLPESEKLIYMSQVMGRFGTPASNLMVNPQLVGMSADQLETECAVAGLLAAEAEADDSSGDADTYRPARKRAPLASLPPFHGKRPRDADLPIFSDTELDPCKQDTDDEISTAELFAPLGI